MKRILPVALIALITCTLIVSYLSLFNNMSGADVPDKTFTCYNWSNPDEAKVIFSFWHTDPLQIPAVKKLIMFDYLLMVVYCSSLCFIFYQLQKNEQRKWIKLTLQCGLVAILIGTAIDAVQDTIIYRLVTNSSQVMDMRPFTYSKFFLFLAGMASALFVFLPQSRITWPGTLQLCGNCLHAIRITLSQFLKSIWIFFPGILFMLLCIASFWLAGQGKDFIVAFTKNTDRSIPVFNLHWSYSRIVFFLAISFWVYVSWYSSKIIYYIKVNKNLEPIEEIQKTVGSATIAQEGNSYPDIYQDFLTEFPRMIGNACFLVLELALLQSPLMIYAIESGLAWLLFVELLLAFYFVNKWIVNNWSDKDFFRPLFKWVGISFLAILFITSFFTHLPFVFLFLLIILLHIIYILYTNLHRKEIKKHAQKYYAPTSNQFQKITQRIMSYFCIPLTETGYYRWFLITSFFAIVFYFICIHYLHMARVIGPFSFILLAFGVLLAFGNVITAFSAKYKVNFHFILFILAFVTGFKETHMVRQTNLDPALAHPENRSRPALEDYLQAWLKKNSKGNDSLPIDMYFVMSNGGASRSGYWTASVLGRLEDASSGTRKFSDQVFCLSGTSGGGVGVASFFSVLGDKDPAKNSRYTKSLQAYLKQDYFTYTFARLLGPDYFHYIIPFLKFGDRAAKLEESFEESVTPDDNTLYTVPFNKNFSGFTALKPDTTVNYPLLFVNTTRVQDGTPGIVTNLQVNTGTFNTRVDVMALLNDTCDLSMASGSILGARFPYLSPAGKISDSYFVDGGYFDNSGAGVVQELIRAIVNIGIRERRKGDLLGNQIKRIRFHVLHIVNSPIINDATAPKPVAPIQNDLLAPVLTILGAYDMQTTVNDNRLTNYLNDLKAYDTILTDYTRISLYKNKVEWAQDTVLHRTYIKEPPYAMNWFMSDTTRLRIDKRLDQNSTLLYMIRKLNGIIP